jgi:hypothetical protein
VVTIEDAAELQLQQPHVVRMETRPPNIEGRGEITQRSLVRNALRMRPDRIIIGEVRAEAVDMLQAMNTGHEGSLTTIHANTPRDSLARLENMVGMAGLNLPHQAARQQIASAITVIVQVLRLTDGKRKITSIQEITGMEGDVVTMQEIFAFTQTGVGASGEVQGYFHATGVAQVRRPAQRLRHCAARQHLRSRAPLSMNSPEKVLSCCPFFFPLDPGDHRAGVCRRAAAARRPARSVKQYKSPRQSGLNAGSGPCPPPTTTAVRPSWSRNACSATCPGCSACCKACPAPTSWTADCSVGPGMDGFRAAARQRDAVCWGADPEHAPPAHGAGAAAGAALAACPGSICSASASAPGLLERLPEALDLIARALRAGRIFGRPADGRRRAAEPIAGEFRLVHDEINYGTSLQQALNNLGKEYRSPICATSSSPC